MKLLVRTEWEVTASGRELYGFINHVHGCGIVCRGEHYSKNNFCFRIQGKYRENLTEIAAAYGITLGFRKRPSVAAFLYRYRFRLGIPIGMILAFFFLFYGSNIVLSIDILGNEKSSKSEILTVLEEEGVTRGSWIPNIDFALCEHRIRAGVEELSWVGMRHTGNRLVVEVKERAPEPEMLAERTPCNIVADKDAQITGFRIGSGQVMRLVGDGVQKGELLVSGIVTDENGHLGLRHAMGEVTGIYTQTEVFTCPYVQEVRTKTGNMTQRKWLDLFSWRIPLGAKERFPDSCRTTSYKWFSLFGKELPVGIYQENLYEFQRHLISFTPEEAQIQLEEQLQRFQDNFLGNAVILGQEKCVRETETGLEWTVTYTLEGEIGVQQDVFVKGEMRP